jgi:restriction system protein
VVTDRKFLVEQCKLATLEAITSLGGRASRAEIHDRALRDGGFTEKQLALPGPPRQPRYPTLVGYYLSWSLSWLKKDGELVREGNAVWALADAAKPAPVADELAPVVIDVAARHAQLTHARRRRWPWSRHAA